MGSRVTGFAGSSIPEQPFRDDDGSLHPRVAAAFATLAAGEQADLVEALQGTRLLSPLVAVLDAEEDGVEKESHLAAPYLVGRDGTRANLAFTSTESARRWDAAARVVPATAEEAAAAAIGDGAVALVLDPADPHAATLGREALHRLAGPRAPVPDLASVVGPALEQLRADVAWRTGADVAWRTGAAVAWRVIAGPEGVPVLSLDLPADDPAAAELLERLAAALAADPTVRSLCPLGLDFALSA